MNKAKVKKTIVPKIRFSQFNDSPPWDIETLGSLTVPVEERVGTKEYVLLSVTAGKGLISQKEKFGREIAGNAYRNYYVIKRNDFAYNKNATKQFPEGFIAMLTDYEEAAVPSSVFICFRFINNECDPKFFNYLFLNNYHGAWLRKYIHGGRTHGSLMIDKNYVWEMPIPLPSLVEQQKISACLSSLDDLITSEVQKREDLKRYLQGLMQKLFPSEGRVIPEIRFPEFKNTTEWERTTLGNVVTLEPGRVHRSADLSEKGRYIVVDPTFIDTEGKIKTYTNSASLLASKGEVLMALSAPPNNDTLAKCFLVDKDQTYMVSSRVCKLIPKNVDGLFLFHIVNRNTYFLNFEDGLRPTNLRANEVLACPISLPSSLEEQRKIAEFLSDVTILLAEQAHKIEALEAHRKGLIQNLFTSIEEMNA